MASKAQREAVRSRADKANANIGSFCKAKTILPLSGIAPAIQVPAPDPEEPVSISSVFDTYPVLEMSQQEIDRMKSGAYEEPADDYVMDEQEAAAWEAVRRDMDEAIYARIDAEDRAESLRLMGLTEEEWAAQIEAMEDED